MAQLLSVNVGLPRDFEWKGKSVYTAVWKDVVRGRRKVERLNIDGDGQGDLVGHGGEHRAVLVYQIDSYRYWERQLGRKDFVFGQFGENFTVEGLPDDEVVKAGKAQNEQMLSPFTPESGHPIDAPASNAFVAHHRNSYGFVAVRLITADIPPCDVPS